MVFTVHERFTGRRITTADLVRENPPWLQRLTYASPRDLEFAVGEDGELYLIDADGNSIICPTVYYYEFTRRG